MEKEVLVGVWCVCFHSLLYYRLIHSFSMVHHYHLIKIQILLTGDPDPMVWSVSNISNTIMAKTMELGRNEVEI